MKLTNNFGAPESIVAAVKGDTYSKDGADFSITELIKPPQIRRLWQEHGDEIEVDVRDEIWKLFGKGVHAVLEIQAGDVGIKEQRLHAEHEGVTISGAIDLVTDAGVVTDYKVTSTYTVQRGLKVDWEAQLNLYGWLLRQNDIEATKLSIVALCRDWIPSRIGKQRGYPESPIVELRVPLWSNNRQDKYLDTRVRVHSQKATLPCTPEERWGRGVYQVTGGNGRPKVFDSHVEATAYTNKQDDPRLRIIEGEGKWIRCESWCEVAPYCPQWKATKGERR